ncbi:MarR family winged helix-turn-helix transcriptional regulator [Frondihabitans australicus]|uniref:DNA-binding MarR family transcriptional regulator n=1 Tax=Frondihabitans australicus TaxID=386892 RepID=A0A495IC01_9MICO|nr:MarR family transcriptional regulator [Frondihabitans australicus]RKR73449.1 DNA-binding MarR family transcriptional regulator [Frondihabitans australicus]
MADALNPDELGAYFALVAAGDLLQRAVSTQLAEHGLTPLQFSILATLFEASGAAPESPGLRMSDLADTLVVSRSGLTYQVTQLEKAGLVSRSSSSADSRGVVAALTPEGLALIEAVFPGHVALVRAKFLDLVSADELATIRSALGRVSASLR